ncbi:unnamed protein product, partial [Scytosiphon promiscuus]
PTPESLAEEFATRQHPSAATAERSCSVCHPARTLHHVSREKKGSVTEKRSRVCTCSARRAPERARERRRRRDSTAERNSRPSRQLGIGPHAQHTTTARHVLPSLLSLHPGVRPPRRLGVELHHRRRAPLGPASAPSFGDVRVRRVVR